MLKTCSLCGTRAAASSGRCSSCGLDRIPGWAAIGLGVVAALAVLTTPVGAGLRR